MAALVAIAVPLIANNPTNSNNQNLQPITQPVVKPAQKPVNKMVVIIVAKEDDRALRLAKYFRAKGSPFTPYAKDFITIADKYNIDWTLLPAIANLESQLGKQIPTNSYNPYGWNNGKYRFASWVAATETVAKALRTRYVPSGEITANRIGRTYATSPTWASRVNKYQAEINRW